MTGSSSTATGILTVVGLILVGSSHGLNYPEKIPKRPVPPVPLLAVASSRRQLLTKIGGTATASAWSWLAPQDSAHAARGAAELDLEYYARSLMSGNKKEGSVLPSTPPPVPSPRVLQGPLLPLLLNKECSPSCIPIQALIQQIQTQSKGSNRDVIIIARDIQERVDEIRDRTRRSFAAKAKWNQEEVSDQYYFDFTAYALWKTCSELIPDPVERDRFVRNMGRMLVEQLRADGLLTAIDKTATNKTSLVGSTSAVTELLSLFKSSNFCKGYRIRTSDDVPASSDTAATAATPLFDELDDDCLQAGGTVDCLVSVYEPATLGAALQINGEQSRFGPDLVGPSLAALWETSVGVRSSWETFFVDPTYRPNPKDYFPNEQLLQYTLSKMK